MKMIYNIIMIYDINQRDEKIEKKERSTTNEIRR